MKIRIINQSSNPLPGYETKGSAGMDLRANLSEPLTIQTLERVLIPTGIFIELPEGYEAQIRPRSGLSLKKGLSLANTPGTIDSDYRGEIKIIMVNLSNELQTIEHSDRIAQMIITKYDRVEWESVEILDQTKRGSGGFGHTGTH